MAPVILCLLALAGCATAPPRPPAPAAPAAVPATVPAGAPEVWWYVRFRLTWPDGTAPLWWPDLRIADRVIGPVLEAEGEQIRLWRIHRRAARDPAGRQFSFIFRATPATARRINRRLAASPDLAQLQQAGILERVSYDNPDQPPDRPELAATSDRNWTPELQRAWPYFIMGVSRLWLELIRAHGQATDLPRDPDQRYQVLSDRLDELWREQGGHALLHHLSAVFGYRQIEITRRELVKF
jgi:hypothetical protein